MVEANRWKSAQAYEQGHWDRLDQRMSPETNKLRWYQWKAEQLEKHLTQHLGRSDHALKWVLEVGSGPIGIVTFLGSGCRVALDPLMSFFAGRSRLVELQSPDVTYLTGKGEEIPCPDGTFNLVIIDNAIDHAQSPEQVLAEIRRVLIPEGHLYFTLNVHGPWGLTVRRTMERFQVDKGHPHSYSRGSVRRLITRSGLRIVTDEMQSRAAVWWENLVSKRPRDKLKLAAGICEYFYTALCRKRD